MEYQNIYLEYTKYIQDQTKDMIYFGHTVTWDKIEILKEIEGWYKIRTKEGDVRIYRK